MCCCHRQSTAPGQAFVASLFNSLKVAGMATVAALIVAIPSAWAVSRTPSVGWSLYAVIATYMLPPVALAVPLYMALAWVGLLNNVFGLALVYLTILAPFTTWLMKSGFNSIPREIESAATMDGARLDQILRLITLPLAAPVMATAALFAFLLAWDEFFYALLVHVGPAGQNLDRGDRRSRWRTRLGLRIDCHSGCACRPPPADRWSLHAACPDRGPDKRRRQRMSMNLRK